MASTYARRWGRVRVRVRVNPNLNPDPNPNPNSSQVGTFGGSEDHTAIMCCTAGHLAQYAFCPTRLEATLAFP